MLVRYPVAFSLQNLTKLAEQMLLRVFSSAHQSPSWDSFFGLVVAPVLSCLFAIPGARYDLMEAFVAPLPCVAGEGPEGLAEKISLLATLVEGNCHVTIRRNM